MAYVKDILRPGTYYPPGAAQPVRYTRGQLRQMCQTGNRMIRAGWTIPVCVEHQDGAKPGRQLSLAEARARGHVTFARRFRLTPDDRLQAVLDDPADDEDRRLLEKLKFVSPETFKRYRTGDGRVWENAVTHIALTPTPVNHRQDPIQRLSLAAGAVRLSLADYREGDMADERDEELPGGEESPEGDEPTPETEPDAEVPPPEPEGPPPGEGGNADDAAIVAAGEELGIHLPASALADLGALKMALLTAFKTACMTKDQHEDQDPPDDEEEALPEGHELNGEAPEGAMPPQGDVGGGAGVALSLAALPDRERKLAEKAIETGREKLLGRLNRCRKNGQVTQGVYTAEAEALGGVQLSLNAAGDLIETRLEAKLEAWEALPHRHVEPTRQDGKGDGKSRLSRAAVQEPPPRYDAGPPRDDKEAAPVLDAWGQATGLPEAP